MIATRASHSDTRAARDTRPPPNPEEAPRRRLWACAYPMTGVRYYRFVEIEDVLRDASGSDGERDEAARRGGAEQGGA